MDKDLAKHVARATFRSMSQLQELTPLLKAHCEPTEYDAYLRAIASVTATASKEIFQKVYADHPGIESEVKDKIAKYGKFI